MSTTVVNSGSIIEVKAGTNITVSGSGSVDIINKVFTTDVIDNISNQIEIKSKTSIEVKDVNNLIEVYKSGIIGGSGGDSLWEVDGLETIAPKFDKKINASHLTGELSGGLFQP